jgi:hypothetical protein
MTSDELERSGIRPDKSHSSFDRPPGLAL